MTSKPLVSTPGRGLTGSDRVVVYFMRLCCRVLALFYSKVPGGFAKTKIEWTIYYFIQGLFRNLIYRNF